MFFSSFTELRLGFTSPQNLKNQPGAIFCEETLVFHVIISCKRRPPVSSDFKANFCTDQCFQEKKAFICKDFRRLSGGYSLASLID